MEIAVLLVTLLGGLALAHVVGLLLHGALRVRPGHVRRVMPSLPLGRVADGPRAAVRWRRTVRRAEGKVLAELEGGASGVGAASLAARVHEDEEVVEAALARLRQEIPCRLKVTRSGHILHDFDSADIVAIRDKRRAGLPVRGLFFALAALANVGAVWPVVTVLLIAFVSLEETLGGGPVAAGVQGLALIAGVLGGAWVVGGLLYWLCSPLTSSPRLGPAGPEDPADAIPELVEPEVAEPVFLGWFGSSSDNGRSSSGSSSFDLDIDADDAGGCLRAGVVLLLVVVVIVCLFTLYVWLRGLWRAIVRVPPDHGRTSPTTWVRSAPRVDAIERYVPTNDLVGRLWRALRRAHGERRPADRELGPRVLSRARRRGWITALEIALAEGLDVHEAVEAGARLCQMTGGETCVVGGELGFRFPERALASVRAEGCPDLMAEYLTFSPDGPLVQRNREQDPRRLPVNLVGLQFGHLEGAARLAAGSWLMAATAVWALGFATSPLICVAATLCAIGCTTLLAATRYTAAAVASLGVRRDFRRALFQEVNEAVAAGRDRVERGGQIREVQEALQGAWAGLDPALLEKEIYGVANDLDLEPTPERGKGSWSVAELRRRLERVRGAEPTAPEGEVVHEADVETDRVKLLA